MTKAYDAVVVSAGGAGTTMMLRFLAEHLTVNHFNSFHDGIKHANRPTHPIFDPIGVGRAIYLVADPREVVLSLFRRDYAQAMAAKISAEQDNAEDYGIYVRGNRREDFTLQDFLAEGRDTFGLVGHWRRWTQGPHAFPVLVIHYSALPSALEQIAEFLDLAPEAVATFPAWRPRESSLDALSQDERDQLDRIYGPLAAEIAEYPSVSRPG